MAEGTKISFIRSIYSGGTAMDYFDGAGYGGLNVVGGADDISVNTIFGNGPICDDADDIKCECLQNDKVVDCKNIKKDEPLEDDTVEIDIEIGIHDDGIADIDMPLFEEGHDKKTGKGPGISAKEVSVLLAKYK